MKNRIGFICPHCGEYTEHENGGKIPYRLCHICGEDNYIGDKDGYQNT